MRELREEMALTQEQFACRVGIAQGNHISQIELGIIWPSRNTMEAVGTLANRQRGVKWERLQRQKSGNTLSVPAKEPKREMRALGNSRGNYDNAKSGAHAV